MNIFTTRQPMRLLITISQAVLIIPVSAQWQNCSGGSQTCTAPGQLVGIGTTTPTQWLENAGWRTALGGDSLGYHWFVTNTGTSEPNNVAFGFQASSGIVQSIGFFTSGAPRVSINSSGYVGIGTSAAFPLTLSTGPDRVLNFRGDPAAFGTSQGGAIIQAVNSAQTAHTPITIEAASVFINAATHGNVGIGTTNPQHPLHVNGTIGATEIVVSSTGADYVFDPSYRLAPLTEVATYIQENHHLPDVPSAKEVQQNGLGIGEMQVRLLAKIEELTLHLIRENERNNSLELRLRELEKQNSELSEKVNLRQ